MVAVLVSHEGKEALQGDGKHPARTCHFFLHLENFAKKKK